ncbi:MAG: ABC transporter substrate-binding protein, partial [Actinopolymorphaceae bacterium]
MNAEGRDESHANSQQGNRERFLPRDPSRRHVLRAGGIAAATVFAASCDLLSTDPQGKRDQGDRGAASLKAKEAPELTKLVESGELPELKERLPASPMVVKPVDRLGTYGGQWDLFGDSPPPGGGAEVYYEWLVRWSPDWSEVLPNLAESWEIEDDGREYTFHLREGVKWSDGEPFTTEDIAFAYNDVVLNEETFSAP